MFFNSDFMRLYEELSLINEAKNKNKSNQQKVSQKDISKEVQQILKVNQLITISEAFGVAKSTSDTGWTFLVPANKISDFKKQVVAFDFLVENKLKYLADSVSVSGWPRFASGNLKNTSNRSIVELDFGTYKDRNQLRGLGFTISCNNHKYFIIGNLFTKKDQKINSDDLEVKAVSRLYDLVVPQFNTLKKSI